MSDVRGIGELSARLDKVASVNVARAVRKAALLVQGAAKANVLVESGELRGSIYTDTVSQEGSVNGVVYTNKKYAPYVEFGTGPRGQQNHEGISPEVSVAYTQSPWWIHEGSGDNEVDRETGERYGWFYIDTPEGRFYHCSGQPASPFLYPALKNNKEAVMRIIMNEAKKNL